MRLYFSIIGCLISLVTFAGSLYAQSGDGVSKNSAAKSGASKNGAPTNSTYKIDEVAIEGNQRIDSEALKETLGLKPGVVTTEQVSTSVKTLYKTGFFDQVTASVVTRASSKRALRFLVVEKPVVRKVYIKGNEGLSENDLSEILNFGPRRFIDATAIGAVIQKAIRRYQATGYYDATFQHSVVPIGDGQVDITFTVDEGKRYKIRKVSVVGLKEIDSDDIEDVLQTKTYKWWSSWLFGTGRVNPEYLENDKLAVQQYLLDHGYVDGSVSDAAVEKKEDGLVVSYEVSEGPQYKFGDITASGDLIEDSQEKTLEGLKSVTGEVFSATKLREDSIRVSDKFTDLGYAFANVVPNTAISRDLRQVMIEFSVDKGIPVTIDRINISGNTKTYDNVIRRELRVGEQELFSGSKVKRSQALLERTGYFEEVSINTEPTQEKDKVDLNVNVRDGSTGSFSAGAGYSSADGALLNAHLSEANVMGTGRSVGINFDIGTRADNIVLNLDDRRFNDTFWAVGLDALKTDREFSDFDRHLQGGGGTIGYPLEELSTASWLQDVAFALKYEYVDIEIDEIDYEDAAQLVIDSEGTSTASGLTPRLTRNTINNPLNPTEGSNQTISVEGTGLGGSEEYYLVEFKNQYYTPIAKSDTWDLVFSWRFRIGYGETYDDEDFPLFRRFFPGGINSVRGFKNRTLGPKDEEGNEYGGSKQVVNNLELILPLVSSAGLKWVVFYDFGQAYDDDESITVDELRHAYGYGLRWTSPLGPIRIEFGHPIDREEGEDSMVTLFSFGAPL